MQEGQNKERKQKLSWIIIGLCVSSAFFIGVAEYLQSENIFIVFKKIILIIMLIMLIFSFIKKNQKLILKIENSFFLIIIGFFLSLAGVLIARFYPIYHLWMLGSIIIAMTIHNVLGITFHLLFTLLLFLLNPIQIEYFAFYLIIGILLCSFSEYEKNLITILYMIITISSINIALWVVLHDFNSKTSLSIELFFSVISIIVVCLITSFIQLKNGEKVQQKERQKKQEKIKLWEEITKPDFELLKILQNYSKSLYIHSIDVGEIAFRAALELDCNAFLAKLGGFYHEIGRINGNDYIEEGIRLVEKYHFPEEVIAIIREHNAKVEKPKSKEAAIVLLTDSILSTLEYMEKQEEIEPISKEELIENIFENRLTKGTLDECELSICDFQALKYFYLYNCF